MDIIIAFADYLCLVGYGVHVETEPPWILPDLKSTSQPGAKLGAQMKALLPLARGGAVGYQDVSVDSLPDDTAGAGVRHGVTDHLQTEAPIEINLHGTGQTSRAQESTFRENYASADKGACSTVSRILGGFPAPQWGTSSKGPLTPGLDCLQEIGVDLEQLNLVIDEINDIHSASNFRRVVVCDHLFWPVLQLKSCTTPSEWCRRLLLLLVSSVSKCEMFA